MAKPKKKSVVPKTVKKTAKAVGAKKTQGKSKPKAKAVPKPKRTYKRKSKKILNKVIRGKKYLTNQNKIDWEKKSVDEQTQYLKDHPDSKYVKLGVKKNEQNVQQSDNNRSVPSAGNAETSQTTNETGDNKGEDNKSGEEKTPSLEIPAPSPKIPLKERLKSGFSQVFNTIKAIPKDLKEGFNEGIHEGLTGPKAKEQIKTAIEEYRKNPPQGPKTHVDVAALAIGAAAILAVGALAVAAPGLAIVVGLQLMDKSPELLEQLSRRAERRDEKRKEDAENYQQHDAAHIDDQLQNLYNLVGDSVGHNDDLKSDVRKFYDDSENSEDDENKDDDTTDDTTQEKTPETSTDSKSDEQKTEDTKTGESPAQENKDGQSSETPKTEDKSANLETGTESVDTVPEEEDDNSDDNNEDDFDDEDYDDNYDDEEEEDDEPPPPPPKKTNKRKGKVQAVLAQLGNTFTGFDENIDPKYNVALENALAYVTHRYKVKAKEEQTGTYAALKLHPSSARLLADWFKNKGVENVNAPGEMHITICYSKNPIEYKPLSFVYGGREVKAKEIGLLGREQGKQHLVVHLQKGQFPHRRFNYAKSIGASHDFPDYLPHISVASPGHGIKDASQIKFDGFDFPLIVDYEYSDALRTTAAMDIPKTGWVTSKPNPVRAQILNKDGKLTTKEGAVLNYTKGDYKLLDGGGNKWTVKPTIFKEKYVKQSDGTWDKKKLNYAYKIHEGEPLTIQTLEGPVQALDGHVIMTGTQDEQWPIPRERFDELYSVLLDNELDTFLKISS